MKAFKAAPEAFMATTYARPPIVLSHGSGVRVWDTAGKPYLDFTAGIAVTGLGHSDPQVADIISEQARTLVHCSNLYFNEWTPKLSQALVERTIASGGMSNAARVFVCNSGSEANEAALKFARKAGGLQNAAKTNVVAFRGAFHGRTYGALSATPKSMYQAPFAPMVPGFTFGDLNSMSSLDLITPDTCAVIVEPIQGEGGVYPANTDWLVALRRKCTDNGAILIYDEIQCGLGRTGSLWAHAAAGEEAQPDIVTMAKALGNGYPIGATMISERVNDALNVGDHGTTYGGNPLACRVGLHVLERLSSPELLSNVQERSEQIRNRAQKWVSAGTGGITDVRGRGLILGLQLSSAPNGVLTAARDNGLLLITCGTNTIRLVPALNISESEVTEGLDILEAALNHA